MKTDTQLRVIENSKEFKGLISKSNMYFRQKEKLQNKELKRYNKKEPLGDLTEQIRTAKENMNYCLNTALNLLKQ